MLKKKITFEDFDGETRTEEYYFNFTEAEVQRYNVEHSNDGLIEYLREVILTKNAKAMMAFIDEIITISYGVKSEDGKRFIKDPDKTREFTQTEAYSNLYMELMTTENAITDFLIGCMPKKLVNKEARKMISDSDVKDYIYGNKSLEVIAKNANT